MKSTPFRFEDYAGAKDLDTQGTSWEYSEAIDTKAVIAVLWSFDRDEDGVWILIEESRILDNGSWRELTDEERDEYFDELRDWIKAGLHT